MSFFGKKKESSKDTNKTKTVKKVDSKKASKVDVDVVRADSLLSPIVTEKSHDMAKDSKYVFRIDRTKTKKDVKRDVENKFNVTVVNVNIIKIPAKKRTIKYNRGYQSVGKKAIVTLKEGQKIALFETA